MKKKVKSTTLKREFNNILDDIDSLLQESANLTGKEFDQARDQLQKKVSSAKETAMEITSDLSRRAKKTAKKANRGVHEEPWKAVAVGAIAGLLMGVLSTRR